jgi:hypothetical protein
MITGPPKRSSSGLSYSQARSMTGRKDIRIVIKYDHARGNTEENPINFLHYDAKKGE